MSAVHLVGREGRRETEEAPPKLTKPIAGVYQAGAERNVYVVGGPGKDHMTVTLPGKSGKQVVIGGIGKPNTFQVGESLGAVVAYGGGANDEIKAQGENPQRPGAVELDGGPATGQTGRCPMEELLVDGIQQDTEEEVEQLYGAGGEDDLAQGDGANKSKVAPVTISSLTRASTLWARLPVGPNPR